MKKHGVKRECCYESEKAVGGGDGGGVALIRRKWKQMNVKHSTLFGGGVKI